MDVTSDVCISALTCYTQKTQRMLKEPFHLRDGMRVRNGHGALKLNLENATEVLYEFET